LTEDATAAMDDGNPVAVRVWSDVGVSDAFSLTVHVREKQPDLPEGEAGPGEIGLAGVSMNLVPVGPGGTVAPVDECDRAIAGTGYEAVLSVTCRFSAVEVNTYTAEAIVNGDYYDDYTEDVLVVYDPGLGFATGGGWFYWPGSEDPSTGYPGDKTNFGFTMSYNNKGTNIKGNLLMISHQPDGSIYRIKSNALYGLALGEFVDAGEIYGWASFSGKSTYLEPGWLEPIGNHEFIIYVEDRDEPGTGTDRMWVEVIDRDGIPVEAMSMPEPALENTIPTNGGNLVVPH